MSVRRSNKQTLAVIVHTISIAMKIVKDGQSCILMSFGVKMQTSTIAAYGIAKSLPHRTNNVLIALLYTAIKTLHTVNLDIRHKTLRDSKIRISQNFDLNTMIALHHGSR